MNQNTLQTRKKRNKKPKELQMNRGITKINKRITRRNITKEKMVKTRKSKSIHTQSGERIKH